MNTVRLGIIGVGNIGTTHVQRALSDETPEITLTAVADRKASRRAWCREHLSKDVAIFEEGSDLIASGACDAVLIAVPHYQHPMLTIDALEHGLHVMCEKPVGVYTLAVRDMIAAADRHPELTFAVMFNQRTNCVYRKLHDILQSGEMGAVKRVNWIITDWYRTDIYYASGAWRATWAGEGGGVLLNQCPHQLDLFQWLFGLPVRVRAFCSEGKWHDIEVEDDVTAYMEFENGATGVFITTTGDTPGTNRLEVSTEYGKIVVENDVLTIHKLEMNEREFCRTAKNGFSTPKVSTFVAETDGKNPQHTGVLNAFAAHILHGAPLIADGREGIKGLMLSNAMHLSSWKNRTLTLPINEDEFLRMLNKRREASRHKEETDIVFDTANSYGSKEK